MDDLISRQMLLEYIHGEPVGRLLCDKYNLDGLIEQLPPANCSEIPNSSDTISRQAAIDALNEQIEQCNKSLSSFDISIKDEFAVKVERASLVAFREILEYLPPALLSTNLASLGTDCISRQQAIDALDKRFDSIPMEQTSEILLLRKDLREMPPIQPKRGRWLYCEDSTADCVDGYRCDQCGFFVPWDYTHKGIDFIQDYNFCPSCGAKMEATE